MNEKMIREAMQNMFSEHGARLAYDMRQIIKEYGGDSEATHIEMVKLIVKEFRNLGYDEAMDIFEKQEKWYM